MKGLSAWIAGAALAGSLIAPAILNANQGEERQTVRYYPGQTTGGVRYYPAGTSVQDQANCDVHTNADVHYVPTGVTYLPSGTEYSSTIDAVPIAEPGMIIAGNRVYYISDNPRYDLSGANESIYLVPDGQAYRAPSARTAQFAAAGGVVSTQVVAVPAEYRQDWLAVAAGDRPVRCIPAMGSIEVESNNTSSQMTSMPEDHDMNTSYTSTGTRYVNRSHTRHVMHHRKSHSKTTNASFVSREPVQTETTVENTGTTVTAEVAAPPMGELFQIGNSWYMVHDGDWTRSDSWRGPFFPVKKGHVPREVRESAKRHHSPENDAE